MRSDSSTPAEVFASLMHYAVKKTGPYLEPACVLNRTFLKLNGLLSQGMSVNRGRVNCKNCLRMMGGS